MSKRRRHPKPQALPLSVGPLAPRLARRFPSEALVFSDASGQRFGGLAAVIYQTPTAEPLILRRTVAPRPSHELELRAAVMALEEACRVLPGEKFALFSDNSDTVERLNAARRHAHSKAIAENDPMLAALFVSGDPASILAYATSINWLPGHGRSRGNALADEHARRAAVDPVNAPKAALSATVQHQPLIHGASTARSADSL